MYLCRTTKTKMPESLENIPCVVLAGGFGTRLQSLVKDVVKPMAWMGHKPFLHVLLDHLHQQGTKKFVLALGYKADSAISYFNKLKGPYSVSFSIENEPLGTGGALRQALQNIDSDEVIVLNGDTFFDLNLNDFLNDAHDSNVNFFMALKSASDFGRYGNVVLESGTVQSFNADDSQSSLQNAGVYWLKRADFLALTHDEKFSLESDLFPALIHQRLLGGKRYLGFFIDIGVPEDYLKAQQKFSKYLVDSSWTLFLDRDGVINVRKVGDYIKSVDEFKFLPGVLHAISKFSHLFGRIIVVTNQQGISKGLMTERNLDEIHRYMSFEVEKRGGRIDKIYFAPQLSKENSIMRKPNIGMGLKAKEDFPEIDFQKSIMIGDSDSDIAFGQALGMITVKLDAPELSQSKPTIRRPDLNSCLDLFEPKN